MSLSWDGMFAYAFPPFRILLRVLLRIKQSDCKIILIAPAWPKQAWFPEFSKSGPPSKEIVLPIADLYPLPAIVEGTNCLISNR
jgi:hypothetical protein